MDALVLSTGYEPMYRVGWRRAMILWISERAELVETYPDRRVRTVSRSYPVPSVLRYVSVLTPYRGGVRFNRDNVYARDRGCCQYCGERLTRREATYDHVVPRSVGGGTAWDNVVLACRPCNQFKADRTPRQAGLRLLQWPEMPRSLPTTRDFIRPSADIPPSWRPYLEAS